MSNVVCSVDTCPVILSAVCVVYQGENLIYTGITDGDNLQAALQKIDGAFADAGLGYAFQNGVIQTTPGVPVELGGSLLHDTTISGNYKLTLAGRIEASALITTGGTSSQFVKGNGTLDSNAYQLAGNYITALTGDGTAVGPGSAALTLATVNANPGTYGTGTLVPRITVDAKGRVTSITTTAIPSVSGILVFEGDVTGSGITGAPVTLTLATVNPNVYNSLTFLNLKVNAKGLVTGASPVTNLDIEGALGYVPVPNTRTITINGITQNLQANRTWTFATGVASVTASAPLASTGGANPNISITKADATTDGYLDNVDWVTFNSKQAALNGTGLVRMSGTTVTYDNTAYTPQSRTLTINGVSFDLAADRTWTINSMVYPAAGIAVSTGTAWGTSLVDNSTNWNTAYTERISSASAPLSIASNTISISQASGLTNGYLSSGDWTTFNNKQPSGSYVITSRTINTNAPLQGGGDLSADRTLSITQSGASADGYLSSTDWNTFNNKQPAAHYITDLTGEATGTGPGIATVTLSTPAVTGKVLTGVNITGGTVVATDTILEGFGKLQNQINGLIGGSIYEGVWNAATNTPTLTSGVGTDGHYYIVNVAGNTNLNGITSWNVGDWAIFHGGVWQKVDNTDAVISVNGYTGAVSLVSSDIPEGLTNLYFTNTRARQALSLTTTGSSGSSAYDDATGIFNIPTYTLAGLGGQPALNGTGFVKISGTTITYDNSTYALDSDVVKLTGTQTIAGNKYFTGFGLFDNTIFIKQDSSVSFLAGYNSIDSDSTGIIFSLPAGNMAKFILTSLTASRDYTLPNVSGTIALTSDIVPYTLPIASTTVLGGVKVDGSTITINATTGVISGTASYSLPIATASVLGGVKIGAGVSVDAGGIISVSTNYQAPLGGTGFVKSTAGTISYDTSVYLTTASAAATYAPLTGTGASGTWAINITGSAGTATDATKLPLAGGTMSGILYSTYNTATGRPNLGFNVAKTVIGNYHIQNGGGPGNDNGNQAAITFQGGVASEAQAGIYVLNNGSYGTSMGFATTNSYATGPQLFMTATNDGVVNFPRARPTYAGNTILDAGNYNSYSPTLTGGGASGTWAISISGNAATATSATSATSATTAATATNSTQLNGISSTQIFNNMGNNHSTYTDFNSVGNFGVRYLQGSTNGPGTGATQYYGFTLGLGNDYAYGTYGTQFYWNRVSTGGSPYVSVRFQEGGSWTAWYKIYAGYADTAGTATSATNSTNATYVTHLSGRTDSASYNVVWASGNPSHMYSCDAVRIQSSTGTIFATTFSGALSGNATTATTAGSASTAGYIPTYYAGGQQTNPQVYFSQSVGLRVAMTGAWSVWSDTLWINGYAGGDVLQMCALHTLRNGTPRMAISVQASTSTSYGTFYEFVTSYNIASQTVGNTTSISSATGNNYNWTGLNYFVSNRNTSTDSAPLQAYSNNGSGAIMSFHRGGYYAVNFGLDSDNVMRIGGWSAAVNRWQLDMSGNQTVAGSMTAGGQMYSSSWFYSEGNAGWYNNTYGQGIRPAKANLTYGSIVNLGENFNGYGGYGITNTYNTLYMQNSGGDHGFFRDGGGGGWSFFYHQNYNCAGIGTDATDPSYSLHIIKYGGSNTGWIIWSDRRIKENIKTIDNALDKVLSLRGVYYNKIDDPNKERCVGYIAQEVMEVVPELVVYSEELDMYNMNYGPMVGMLTEAVKEHHAKTVAQQAEIDTLKEQVQTLLNHINNGI